MDEIKELLKQLGLLIDDDNREDVVAAFKKSLKPVYQAVFDDGHGVAMSQQQTKIDKLEGERDTLKTDRDRLKADLKKIKEEGGDVTQIHSDYQAAIQEKDTEIARLNTALKDESRSFNQKLAVSKLQAKLAPSLVDGYEELLVGRPATQQLLTFDDDGKLRVLQPGKSVPFAGDEDEQIQALAEELLKGVKPVFRASTVREGSGGDGVTGGGGGDSKRDFFAGVKTKAETANPSGGIANPEAELARRLGRAPLAGV